MNKKGISLAQLLSVVVVMAIISAIAILLVGKVIENTKIEACQDDALVFYSSINNLLYTSLDNISTDENNQNTVERFSDATYPSIYCEDLGIRKSDIDKYYDAGNADKFLNLSFYLKDGKLILNYEAGLDSDLILDYQIINGNIY